MGFWQRVIGADGPVTPNANGPSDARGGDTEGIEFTPGDVLEQRALPILNASAWDGWPTGWQTPDWHAVTAGVGKLVDIAWQCLDMQSNIVSSMPVYRIKGDQIIDPAVWMRNPDPTIYSSWQEFAKQFFWDYQMGEVFVLPMSGGASSGSYPSRFRVIPPFMMTVEMVDGLRSYKLGNLDVTEDVLHIRYSGTVSEPRGRGPLEIAGARMTQINLLQRYANNLAETGGVPLYWIGLDRKMSKSEGTDLLDTWIETRKKYSGHPAVLGGGSTLNQARTMDAKEMGLLEISQFSESRIAGLLGVPPFLVGLAGASGSLTYSNIADLFDFHDRSSLRPKTRMLFEGLSAWALPRGQAAELNRDDYTRLPFDQRVQAYRTMFEMVDPVTGKRAIDIDEIRIQERLYGEQASQALTGGLD